MGVEEQRKQGRSRIIHLMSDVSWT